MPQIKVPAALTGGSSSDVVAVEGATVREAFERHADAFGPELRDSVVADGAVREYIHVFVNGEPVDDRDGLETRVGEDDVIRVVPAASGGRRASRRPRSGAGHRRVPRTPLRSR